jgi:hypothetical protein
MTTQDTQTCQRGQGLMSLDPAGDQLVTEILDAEARGLPLDTYIAARAAGATHLDIFRLDAQSRWSIDELMVYVRALTAGVTTSEFECVSRNKVLTYVVARERGKSHKECSYIWHKTKSYGST